MIHDENTNNKLLVLFVLDKLEMTINEDLLLAICSVENNWIPYLLCKQVVNDLLRAGFVTRVNSGQGNQLIALTTDGGTCLHHFHEDIALSLRESVAEYVRKNRMKFRKMQEFKSDYYRNSDGTFTVSLRILEVAKPLVDLKLVVSNRAVATSIHNSWQAKAPEVYKLLVETLIED